jgi:HSP20 family molecular chaperone IbpA
MRQVSSLSDLFDVMVEDLEDSLLARRAKVVATKDFREVLELPGVKKSEISISHDGANLWIRIASTKRSGSKSFYLPPSRYDIDKISVTYEDGILTVEVPLMESLKAAPKEIPIK